MISKWILSHGGHCRGVRRFVNLLSDSGRRELLVGRAPAAMTNHPRYSPPPPAGHRRGHRPRRPGYPTVARPGQAAAAAALRLALCARSSRVLPWPHDPYRGAPAAAAPVLSDATRSPKAFSRRAFDGGALAIAVVPPASAAASRSLTQPGPTHGQLDDRSARAQRARREPSRGLGRAGRSQGGAQRGEAGDRHGAAVRGGLGNHPVDATASS